MTADEQITSKGGRTRARIYGAAVAHFRSRGYAAATMRDIAAAAGVSLGLSYRYFASKETIVLELYSEHIGQIVARMAELPAGQLADRYHQALAHALETMRSDRGALMALFGAAMAEESGIDLMRGPLSARLAAGYERLVLESDDALRAESARHLGIALYTVHMLVLVFWLYDRSPGQQASGKLISFVHGLFQTLRPMFFLPMIPQGIARLAEIVMPAVAGTSKGAAAQEDTRDGQHQDFDVHRD